MEDSPPPVVDYDPVWPFRFAELKTQLAAALAGVPTDIEHVGSTAVPGLSSRPVIDIDVVVVDRRKVPAVLDRLEAAGYRARSTAKGSPRAFDQPHGGPQHNVCVVVAGSEVYRDHVLLRDLLRRRPDLAARYEQAKRTGSVPTPGAAGGGGATLATPACTGGDASTGDDAHAEARVVADMLALARAEEAEKGQVT